MSLRAIMGFLQMLIATAMGAIPVGIQLVWWGIKISVGLMWIYGSVELERIRAAY